MVETMLIDLKALLVEREDCDAGTVQRVRDGLAQGKTQFRTLRDINDVLKKRLETAAGQGRVPQPVRRDPQSSFPRLPETCTSPVMGGLTRGSPGFSTHSFRGLPPSRQKQRAKMGHGTLGGESKETKTGRVYSML